MQVKSVKARFLTGFTVALFALHGEVAGADAASIFERHLGYTIAAAKTIDGFVDKGKRKQDGFEGCEFDRLPAPLWEYRQ